MKKNLLSFIAIVIAMVTVAQPPCGFDGIHQKLLAADPLYAQTIEANNAKIKAYIDGHPLGTNVLNGVNATNAPIYTIPVVVHIMHTGGAVGSVYNPTDAQILGAINYLNQVYAGTDPSMTLASPTGAAGDLGIRFELARRSPVCAATSGIDRVDATSLPGYTDFGINLNTTGGCPEVTMKNFARWNTNDYYNIYVVNKIDGADGTSGQFVAGYAYFPGASSTVDGTVMLATTMKAGENVLPHEIGHALNLYHPFQGSSLNTQCPANGNCTTDGDRVCDTDPVSYNINSSGAIDFSCRTGANTACPGVGNYSINTESNFMGYTNCFTLFTNGQAARMQAALATAASRLTLIRAGNTALAPCAAALNFLQSTVTHTEAITGTTVSCRTYKDYVYQMLVGEAPTAATTAALTVSGTASPGVDYLVSTDGTFSGTPNTVSFPAGTLAQQPVYVRVYDDATAEVAETIILDFTVNNGGGNIVKGTNAPTLTLFIYDNDKAPVAAGAGATLSIGAAYTANLNGSTPFKSSLLKHRTQLLYTKDELNAAGIGGAANITSITYKMVTKGSTKPYSGFTVSMGNTTATNLNIGFVATPTIVFTGAYSNVAAPVDNVITFTTPFAWDGASNIAINICYDNATADAANDIVQGSSPSATIYHQVYANYTTQTTAGCDLPAAFITANRPNFVFGYSVTGTAIESVVAAGITQNIGVGSNDYFYSTSNKLMMNLSGVGASLGCVATAVEAAGNMWVPFASGSRSAKVFAVTPAINGSTTGYTIALYVNNTELGGNLPAGLKIAKTSATSIANATANNTVILNTTPTAFGSGATLFTATTTGFSRFFLVDGNVIVPITLLNFGGILNADGNVLLNWETGSEQNNHHFDVEISKNGSSFAKLGMVLSKGNSAGSQFYNYLYVKPQTGISYYRLKQTDNDGKFTYSKTIAITINGNGTIKPFVYPVPAKDIITVNFGAVVNKATIELLTADMKVLRRETINGQAVKKELRISNLPKGVYFIKVINADNTTAVMRFIKE